MRTIRRTLSAFVAGFVVVVVAGCSDLPQATEPVVTEEAEGLLSGALGLLSGGPMKVLERSAPLAADETASVVIGPRGGVIRLPQAGLTVRIPGRALRTPTRITVVAPAGNLVGYHFEPHGLQFAKPVTLTQDLSATRARTILGLGSSLHGAYFRGALTPRIRALEILPLNILGILRAGSFRIDHFSGYVIATD